jgi:hypothetical protein
LSTKVPTRALLGTLLLAAGPLGLAPLAAAQEYAPDLAWIDFARIAAGETLLQTGKAARNAVTVDVATRIRAPKERIFSILRQCEIAPEYTPNVVDCRVIESVDDGNAELFVQTVKPAFFLPRFEHVFRLDYFPYRRIEVSRVSGPLAQMRGTWWLLDQQDGSVLLLHSLLLQPGFPVPRVFVRATLRRDLPVILEAVRARAEARSP